MLVRGELHHVSFRQPAAPPDSALGPSYCLQLLSDDRIEPLSTFPVQPVNVLAENYTINEIAGGTDANAGHVMVGYVHTIDKRRIIDIKRRC